VAGFNVWPAPGRPGRPELPFLPFSESVVHRFLNVSCDLSHAIKTLTSRLVRQDLCVKTWGEEGFHEKSPTRVLAERPPGTRGILVLCHLFGQSRVQSILELIDIHGGLRVDAKNYRQRIGYGRSLLKNDLGYRALRRSRRPEPSG
jgi:hypothetical protein